ncbi:putative gluconate periplasmic binding protein with phosphoribosyltransferase domain, GNT I system, partial [Vibrio parahaemolyticus V-223/04]
LGNGYLPWETTIFRCLEKYNASKITDKHGMFAL